MPRPGAGGDAGQSPWPGGPGISTGASPPGTLSFADMSTIHAIPAKAVLTAGLLILALAFAMEDRGWLLGVITPIGPVDHPLAAGAGLLGLILCLVGAYLLRRQTHNR